MDNFFDQCKRFNSCLISFLSFSELFPAYNLAKEIVNLLNIWFGVSIFSPCPFRSGDPSLSKSGISVVSGCSSSILLSVSFVLSSFSSSALKPVKILLAI